MRKLDVKEIHGFNSALGLKLLKSSYLQTLSRKPEAVKEREKEKLKLTAA
jgi:hypothetical protein